ncbi:MAG: entericidin A/B family lipoprotein [Zymomonas mobilis]|uniref:Putative small secreted protein n=1 Tax=Zymomonas mobilis TaxID=542 RepID=A0A542W285_ZYMMB|nr:entericidin A/B family lipoprotein [Zymomonas mobilis]TQL17589.1 putative small secreted protein [Zymomonas mobilis]
MRILKNFLMASAVLALAACNTMQGFGQDLSSAGQSMSNSAERNK